MNETVQNGKYVVPPLRVPENASPALKPPLLPGDPAPWFIAASDVNPNFPFGSLAGRHVVMMFLGSLTEGPGVAIGEALMAAPGPFDGRHAALVIVTADPRDEARKVPPGSPATRLFFDRGGSISNAFGMAEGTQFRIGAIVLDPRLRIEAMIGVKEVTGFAADLHRLVGMLKPIPASAPAAVQAPVLVIPDVFEPAFCKRLIEGYRAHGGEESGYMRDIDGKTTLVYDHAHKRRSDWMIADSGLVDEIRARFLRRVIPEIAKAFQFPVTRMERYLVACYAAEVAGHFNAHRDNTTKGTAHRRFACSLNLNAEEFSGGDLKFPEFGQQTYRPPTGGAVIFSCSLMHEATTVTAGERYAFLPFLYDEAAAKVREANQGFVAPQEGRAAAAG